MLTKPAPLLHLDWLQMQVKWYNKSEAVFAPYFTVKKLSFGTRHFKCIQEIYIKKKRIATMTSEPCSEILDKELIIVKFDNWLLYDVTFRKRVTDFLIDNKLIFISFSRVDFCADFNLFDNGLLPEKFIKKYIYRKCLRLGRTPHVSHNFKQGKKEHIEKGLKFGSNLSEVTAYIYNKTLEMETIKWKPYLFMSWKKGGLDVEKNVWRVEFSMKSGGVLKCNTETGEIDLFLSLNLMQEAYIQKCFYKLYEKYFTFVWNDGQVRKDRMRKIKLFKYIYSPEILVAAEATSDADRSKKIFIKKLHEINNEMRGRDFFMNVYMQKFEEDIIHDSHLQTWAMKKGFNTQVQEKETRPFPYIYQ
jgi:hypothetical protein